VFLTLPMKKTADYDGLAAPVLGRNKNKKFGFVWFL
jgi:hypothetical protein